MNPRFIITLATAAFLGSITATAAPLPDYQTEIEPILAEFCYDCHGDGSAKGQVALDTAQTDGSGDAELWHRVLKNTRAELMPPHNKPQPSPEQRARLEHWIKYGALQIAPNNPDPGHLGTRRLNRLEYQNTIRDLMGIDFPADVEFPPDDTGYGFDNIGSVLTLSPLLLEKYFQAAKDIVREAVPLEARIPVIRRVSGEAMRDTTTENNARRMPFDQAQTMEHRFQITTPGRYRVQFATEVDGAFNYDPATCLVTYSIDDTPVMVTSHSWRPSDKYSDTFIQDWTTGEHRIRIQLEPKKPVKNDDNPIYLEVHELRIEGPMETDHWITPPQYERFFSPALAAADSDDERARKILTAFATQAFRRPADPETIDRLVALAASFYRKPDQTFEQGIAQAFVAILASPRFLLKVDRSEAPETPGAYPHVDAYSLASRLSYFLWSSMPDRTLLDLAEKGQLRDQLPEQWQRMLQAPKADAFIKSFVGQWLQARDIGSVSINARAVLARETQEDPEITRLRERYFTLARKPRESLTEAELAELGSLRQQRRKIFRRPRAELTSTLRTAMRKETESYFQHIVQANRPLVELLDSNYTFLNEPLAKHYGVPDVSGNHMRKVTLPEGHARGGVLTQGTTLIVTSNPTRTSPVKRGLFILENILGTPPPPPPADVPDLESATEEGENASLRAALAQHRASPLCRSCHNRMDPLGLSLESFNAMGMWRDQELQQPIDPAGKLITGEAFDGIADLKAILATERKLDFYRCLTEKLLTYALGRGPEPGDVETVDRIVSALEQDDRFSTLLEGILTSPAFLKTNRPHQTSKTSLARTTSNSP